MNHLTAILGIFLWPPVFCLDNPAHKTTEASLSENSSPPIEETLGSRTVPGLPKVLPCLLKSGTGRLIPGEKTWLEVIYRDKPGGAILQEESAEKVWWIQDRALLILGSSGDPLSLAVLRRAAVYAEILLDGEPLHEQPLVLHPRKNQLIIDKEASSVQVRLAAATSLDASHLAQAAEHLARNLATRNVQGTSYSVFGYGTIIDTAGNWVGETGFRCPAQFVTVEPGTFQQGSSGEACSDGDEDPFEHTLTRRISVMTTEVTQFLWLNLKAAQLSLPTDPSDTTIGSRALCPVQQATWYEALLFANLLSLESGLTPCYYKDASFTILLDASNYQTGEFHCDFVAEGYRLPTEGEWEYMARAGEPGPFSLDVPNWAADCGTPYCVLSELWKLEAAATFCANDPGGPKSVGGKKANPWGLMDVHGNVAEWCWDRYGIYPGTSETDYAGPDSGSARVRRGGSWSSYARYCRSADRGSATPGTRYDSIGFRLVRTLP